MGTAGAFLAAVVDAQGAQGAQGETVTLVTPVAFGTHVPGLGTPARELAKLLKERSNGTLRLDLKEPGEGTAPFEILDKVSDGKVDAGFATAGYWAAKLPAASLFGGFPFGPDAKGYRDWFSRGHGRALYQEMYDQAKVDVHVIPCAFGGAEAGGWFAKEIGSKDDLDGLRMRIFGLGARVMMRLGTVPVLVPGSEIKKAFEDGKIDAAETYTPAVDRSHGLQDAAKILYAPGWHQPATVFELLVNQDRWNALGPEHQSLIESTCGELLQRTLSESANLQASALTAFANQDHVELLSFPEDVLEALRGAWSEVAREEGVRDYLFKEVFEDIERFRSGDGADEKAGPEPDSSSADAMPPPPPGDATPADP
ncbi:MAG: C4-dicarboxylate ABC transporter [Methyloceanibacter sp.]|nr:MAG: C4-dicarboxylate ABC transporter [Methyloceanibacter sp.]